MNTETAENTTVAVPTLKASKRGGRARALADYLECKMSEVKKVSEYYPHTFEAEGGEYMVLSDSEATKKAREYCLDSLWAFSASFLVDYIEHEDRNALIESLQAIQEKLCESANETVRAMLGKNLNSMIEDAICTDGRGHFLSSYDGEENEQGKWFIYRTN